MRCAIGVLVALAALLPSAVPAASPFEKKIDKMLQSDFYGARAAAHELGPGAGAVLSTMLREDRHRGHMRALVLFLAWHGDTAYFDTLKSFVWDRFRGQVDEGVFGALISAQGSLGAIATHSASARAYLRAGIEPSYWASLPWRAGNRPTEVVGELMVKRTINSLSYTDSEEATAVLEQVAVSGRSAEIRDRAAQALKTNATVRAKGLKYQWDLEKAQALSH